jgi:dCMP deaminase
VAHDQPHCNQPDKFNNVYYPHACSHATSEEFNECEAIHAEINALLQCKDVFSIRACISTHRPCIACTKALLNTSCNRIVFLNDHEDDKPKKLWVGAGRTWLCLSQING